MTEFARSGLVGLCLAGMGCSDGGSKGDDTGATAVGGDLAACAGDHSGIYDGDDAGNQDFGIRSPDNLDWSANGMIYINEDRSTSPGSLFGGISGIDASAWQLDPATGVASRILEMNRSAVPQGQTDPDPTDIGNWESSGVVDVSEFFDTKKTMLIMTTQAHNVRDGLIGGSENLVEGGQLFLAEGGERDAKRDHRRRLEPQ